MAITFIDPEKHQFGFSLQVGGNVSFWICDLEQSGVEKLRLDLNRQMENDTDFNVGTLASSHHKLSLKAFTSKAINQMDDDQELVYQLKSSDALTSGEARKICKELALGK
jgi:hypothetical protein